MLRGWIIGLSALLVSAFACWPSLLGKDESLSQDWVGELKLGEIKHFVQLRLAGDRDPSAGTIAFPASGRADIPLSDVSVVQSHVKFACPMTQVGHRLRAASPRVCLRVLSGPATNRERCNSHPQKN